MTIDGTRNYQAMAEDMMAEALFPTLSTYTSFTTSAFSATQRLKGALDFDWYTSDAGFPLIRWHCTGFTGPDDWSTVISTTALDVEVSVAHKGARDIDGTANSAGHQKCTRDIYLVMQACRKQLYDSAITSGPFGILNTSVVSGQGSSPVSCVWDVTFSDATVQQINSEDPDNLGPNAWVGKVTVTIHILES